MVPRFLRSLPRPAVGEPALSKIGREARLPWRELEVAIQQSAGDGSRLKCSKLLLQRSRLPDCLRVRLAGTQKTALTRAPLKPLENARVPYGLKRNFVRPRFAFAFALRRLFCEGVSKARKRRTSSRIPSASSLFFKRLSARSTGSPLRTITSGIGNLLFLVSVGLF